MFPRRFLFRILKIYDKKNYIRNTVIIFFFLLDIRTGFCFSVPTCAVQTRDITAITKIDCCCGMGVAWGTHCELCPLKGSSK